MLMGTNTGSINLIQTSRREDRMTQEQESKRRLPPPNPQRRRQLEKATASSSSEAKEPEDEPSSTEDARSWETDCFRETGYKYGGYRLFFEEAERLQYFRKRKDRSL
jgi:hypothetical protein